MSTLTNRISALRESLRSADMAEDNSFSEVFDAFLELAGSAEFMAVSEPTRDKYMRTLLMHTGRRHANDPALRLTDVRILHYAPAGLFHGSFFAGRNLGTFFYFAQEKQGIVAFSATPPLVHYYRITSTPVPPGTTLARKSWGVN